MFMNFQILLDIGCSFTIYMRRLVEKLYPKKDTVMQLQTQDGNINTSFNVKIDFTLPAIIATNAMTRKCCVNDSARSEYNMILGRDIFT